MNLSVNTIITLENAEKYVVLNETVYDGKKYFMVMGVDENKEIIPTKAAIFEEIIENNESYIAKVDDPELISKLTKILKDQM